MPKRITDNIITGSDPRLGVFLYYSPHFDLNIWRHLSSLTGERTSKDPAFKGFRQSSSRLKQASPIASSLYELVPKEVKEYALYRTLTGQAIKMLKEGMEAAVIIETMKKQYIDPLLSTSEKESENRTVEQPKGRDRVKGMTDFTSFPQIPSGVRKITRSRRSHLLQKIIEGQSTVEYFSSLESDPLSPIRRNVLEPAFSETLPTEEPKQKNKTTGGLIYLGRLPECKKIKMWLRPFDNI